MVLAHAQFETDADFDTACARMDATSVNARWQAQMSKYTPAGLSPLEGIAELQHYFYLGTDVDGSEAIDDEPATALAQTLRAPAA